mgnify:CR=1 FL=1
MYKVLLADDNALSRKAVRQSVSWKNNGCKIVGEAENGVKACQMIRELRPDIVLMDIRMPVMDGLAATRAIRELPRPDARTVPIIAMTANAFADDRQKARDAGMNEHLAKPIDIGRLHQILQKFLG